MGIWKSIFGKSEKEGDHTKQPMPNDFRRLTTIAIELIGGADSKKMENEELCEYLISKGLPEFEASELILFLPTAFCRKLLPELDWPTDYFDYYSENKKIRNKYQDNPRYVVINQETEAYFNGDSLNHVVLNIAGRSAEFNAINQLLQSGGKLENVGLTETLIIR